MGHPAYIWVRMRGAGVKKSLSLLLKLLVIGGLALVILIALYMVDGVITDRQSSRDEAVTSITSSYASGQKIFGPVLVQPYRQVTEVESTDNGKKKIDSVTVESTYTTFPQGLTVKGVLQPSMRRHGLYRVPVYEFDGTMSGHFEVSAPKLDGKVEYGVPYLAFRMSDARGIVGRPVAQLNGVAYPVQGATVTEIEQDNPVHPALAWGTNLRVLAPGMAGKAGGVDFKLDLALNGTQKLEIVPVADMNHFELSSPWAEPLFAGQFLPRTREISKDGFHAVWDVSSLASATQQQLISNATSGVDAINVSLSDTIDAYRLSDRAVKYGILFVFLTFGGFFLFEIAKQMLIHPVQYLLVGACLTVFFLLLISFSEHISFALAYLISSVACIGLMTYYLVFVLHSREYGLAFGGILAVLYAAIYGLLVSEDNALLLGSLLLFGLIAIVMIATRKVDWYEKTADLTSAVGGAPPPPLPIYSAARTDESKD
jgi:inner membrane protein